MPIPVNRPNNSNQRPPQPRQEQAGLPDLEEELVLPEAPPERKPYIPPREEVSVPQGNVFDEDGDPFSQISANDDSLYDNEEEDWETAAPVASPPKPRPTPKSTPRPTPPSFADDDDEDEVKEAAPKKRRFLSKKEKPSKSKEPGYTDDTFIDEKNEKLKPFGRKRAAKVSEFDQRKNMRQKARFIQMGVIGFLVVLVGLGLKNAFFPPATLSENDVVGIVQSETGTFGFPVARGGAFAKDFMQAYLTIDNSSPATKALNDQALSYFYTGGSGEGEAPTRVVGSEVKQTILYGPTIYDSKEVTAYSAIYTIGSLVNVTTQGAPPAVDGSTAKWMFYSVNVYYDAKTDGFYITPASPVVVPNLEVKAPTNLPEPLPLGTGQSDSTLTDNVRSLVYGFIDGYAKSSPSDHSKIDQYILPNPDASLLKGLNNTYKLAGPPESAIQYEAYPTDDPKVAKVRVKVTWRIGDATNYVDNDSTYVMTLNKQDNGTYLVSKFAPEIFLVNGNS